MKNTRKIEVAPVADIGQYAGQGTLVAFNIGYDGLMYFVFALRPLDYREERSDGIFAKTQPAQAQRYRVVALDGSQQIRDILIDNEPFNIHEVAPLPEGILLACGRSFYHSPDNFEKNGRIYSTDGKFHRELLLGDGIQNLQTTADGTIWTSFFDEGVFGNFGWNDPLGSSGLVAWNTSGDKLYEFEPKDGLDFICSCYAMNVTDLTDVWCYYYTDFPLVHIHNKKIKNYWNIPVAGADAFAIKEDHALFRGGYRKHDEYHLVRLGQSEATPEGRIQFTIKKKPLKAEHVVGRGDSIYILQNNMVYKVNVALALSVF